MSAIRSLSGEKRILLVDREADAIGTLMRHLLLVGGGPIGIASDYIKRVPDHPNQAQPIKNELVFNGPLTLMYRTPEGCAIRRADEAEMGRPIKTNPAVELRDYPAEERTFLAWIRTGIALMGFGFVVARFGIFGDQLHLPQTLSAAQPHDFSPWFGAALIATGALVNLFPARRFMRLAGEVDRNQFADGSLSRQGVFMASFLALIGIVMTTYLILFLAQPPDAAFASIASGK
jgi:putative membrane protein